MLKLEKIYTVKSNATADIRKAISRNQCAAGEYEARKVDGGFQIFAINPQPEQESHNEADTHDVASQEATQETEKPQPNTVGEWKVWSQVFDDTRKYIVGRIMDTTQPQHGGNMEYVDMRYTEDKDYCEQLAAVLNGKNAPDESNETPNEESEPQPGYETSSEPATGENAPENPGQPSDDIDKYLPGAQPEPTPPTDDSTPEAQKAESPVELPERQFAVLKALVGVKVLEGKEESGIVGTWIPFKELHESNNPHNLPKPAIPGIAQALIKKNLIVTDWGKDKDGKRAVIVTITEAGIAALQKAS